MKATRSEVRKFYLVNIGQKSQTLQPLYRAMQHSISKGKFKYHWSWWKREGFSCFFSCCTDIQNTNCFLCNQSLPILFHSSFHWRCKGCSSQVFQGSARPPGNSRDLFLQICLTGAQDQPRSIQIHTPTICYQAPEFSGFFRFHSSGVIPY